MSLLELSENPSDAEIVATFKAASVFLHGEFHRAWAGQCINLGGVFRDAAQSLYTAADLIEASSNEERISEHPQAFERAERALANVLARLGGWTALHGYISELTYR